MHPGGTEPDRAGRRPAIRTVAERAGVSHQTVSRVLNDHPSVRAETREQVRAAMADLGYVPDAAARTLSTRRSRTLGVVVLNGDLHGPASTLRHVEHHARSAGYGVRIVHLASLARSSLREVVRDLDRQHMDAVVVVDPHPEDQGLLAPIPADVALVAVGGMRTDGVPSVEFSSGPGVRHAVEHLLMLGHPTVHHVGGPPGWAEADVRRQAWADALEAASRAVPAAAEGDWTARSGHVAAHALLERGDVTAVLCANDQMALGVLHAASRRGLRVPDDLSVIGFDDLPDAAYYLPALTTLRQDFDELGRQAVRLALEQIDAGHRGGTASVVLPPPSLVLRSSTGPPRRP